MKGADPVAIHTRPHLPLVIFDLDGTLIDSAASIVEAVRHGAEHLGVDAPPDEDIKRIIGLSVPDALAVLFPDRDTDWYNRFDGLFRDAFLSERLQAVGPEPMFAGTRDLVLELDAAGILLGIATGKARRGVDRFLAEQDLEGRFVTIQTVDNNPGKPHPSMVLSAMAETGAGSGETVMIGDTTFDMQMASEAGTAALGVAWGNHKAVELSAHGAHHVASDVADLTRWLKQDWLAGS